jgi:hypothetical protein
MIPTRTGDVVPMARLLARALARGGPG